MKPGDRVAIDRSAPLKGCPPFTRGTVQERVRADAPHLVWVLFDNGIEKLCSVVDDRGPGNIRPLDVLERLSD